MLLLYLQENTLGVMNSEPDSPQTKKRRLPIVGIIIAATLLGAFCGPFFDRITITHGPAIDLRIARSFFFGSLVGLSIGVVIVATSRRMRLPLAFFIEITLSAVVVSLLFLNVRWAEERLEESNEKFRARVEEMMRSAKEVSPPNADP
jgi:MFS family permease